MATTGWRQGVAVKDSLLSNAPAFDFYQAVKLLEERGVPFRRELEALDRSIAFRTETGHQFPASVIHNIEHKDAARHAVTIASFGLSGPLGPLPSNHSNWVYEESLRGENALKEFLELFNHRLISLLYLIKKRYSMGLYGGRREDTDLFRYMLYIGGLYVPNDHTRTLTHYPQLVGFAALLSGDRISVPRIENILCACLEAPVKAEAFVGAFVEADSSYHTTLSARRGAHNVLGKPLIAGRQVWRQDHGLRLHIGPVDYARAAQWQPGQDGYRELGELIRYITGDRWVIELDISVNNASIPVSQMTPTSGMTLGYGAWLKTQPTEDDGTVSHTRRVINPRRIH